MILNIFFLNIFKKHNIINYAIKNGFNAGQNFKKENAELQS
jgi:hypothetical protein